MIRDRVISALREAAQTLDPKAPPKKVKAASGGQVFIGLVAAPTLGEWIDVPSDKDELQEAIDAVLAKVREKEPGAEEWMVSDYDEFPNLGEHPGVEKLAKVAKLLEDHDMEIVEAALSEEGGDVDGAESLLDDGYSVYDSEEDYGQQLVDDFGFDNIKNIEWYVNMDQLARDLMFDHTMVRIDGEPIFFSNT